MVTPTQQARQYARDCAALLRSMERIDLREASYIAASEIDVFHFDALRLIKEAIEKGELSAFVVREMHMCSADVRGYIDAAQSKVSVAELTRWLEALQGGYRRSVAA
ncbi:hypothetical protein [Propionivibrio limicola]|uniref:hypothetical protein n=1 Tax=Propionivibrio limicola TaxID=167645 RepID=UPI001291C539|nr:hypothetical protein [Propionivibrio limicola]